MKSKILSALAVVLMMSCTKTNVQLSVKNPISIDRKADAVEVDLAEIRAKLNSESFIIKNAKGEELTYQITKDNKVLLLVDSEVDQELTLTIEKGKPGNFKPHTYARFITERKDDFAWENDKVAFRLYGPALVAVDGPSTGLDIWYKKTPEMIVDKWYKDDIGGVLSYHEDHGEGLDDYKVGPTLGAGSMAPYVDGKLLLNQNFVKQEILENGPLRTTFKLTYNDVDINGGRFSETRTISLDAGSQLSKITQEYGTKTAMDVAAGVIKRPDSKSATTANDKTWIVYQEPDTKKASGIFIALVNTDGWKEVFENTYLSEKGDSYSHTLGVTKYAPGKPLSYYVGYGWTQFGFSDQAAFEKYLDKFVLQQKNPLKVSFK